MLPLLDLAGFKRRSVMPPGDVATVEQRRPGFIESAISRVTSHTYTRLRKRYGLSIPFGQTQPAPVAGGTAPPVVTMTGTPLVGSNELALQTVTPGPLGSAAMKLSLDGGQTWGAPFVTAASVNLPGTGITADFAAGTYSADNVYRCATPCPEQVLWWITQIVTPEAYRARGVNPSDPQLVQIEEDRADALARLTEAANGDTGLLDLPTNEDAGSAITTGGPQGYTEESPYVWTDVQRSDARQEDCARSGTGFVS